MTNHRAGGRRQFDGVTPMTKSTVSRICTCRDDPLAGDGKYLLCDCQPPIEIYRPAPARAKTTDHRARLGRLTATTGAKP